MGLNLDILKQLEFLKYGQAFLIIFLGLLFSRFVWKWIFPFLLKTVSDRYRLFVGKISYYTFNVLVVMLALGHMGLDLKVLLGAAGIFTVAIGFASQTSVSNLISGLFLMSEQPFVVGDTITVEDTSGVVISIDLFSTRLRTFDNLMIRVPNESLMKSKIVNVTHFEIRRIDLKLNISYREDIKTVERVLKEVAEQYYLCLDEPAPLYMVTGFADSFINIQFSVWVKRENYLKVKTDLYHRIKNTFVEKGIEIPFPHRILVQKPNGVDEQDPNDMMS